MFVTVDKTEGKKLFKEEFERAVELIESKHLTLTGKNLDSIEVRFVRDGKSKLYAVHFLFKDRENTMWINSKL